MPVLRRGEDSVTENWTGLPTPCKTPALHGLLPVSWVSASDAASSHLWVPQPWPPAASGELELWSTHLSEVLRAPGLPASESHCSKEQDPRTWSLRPSLHALCHVRTVGVQNWAAKWETSQNSLIRTQSNCLLKPRLEGGHGTILMGSEGGMAGVSQEPQCSCGQEENYLVQEEESGVSIWPDLLRLKN